jgi:hypothetical protein
MTRVSDAPGVELARAKAAFRRASTAWDEVLEAFARGELDDAVSPLQPPVEAEAPPEDEKREGLLERRERQAEEMRGNWPEGKPRRRWWPKR